MTPDSTKFPELHAALQSEYPASVHRTRVSLLNRPAHRVIHRDGFIVGTWETIVAAEPQSLFTVIERIGGDHGWYFADELWKLRGFLDRAVGGIGLSRSRIDPTRLRVNDKLDFWHVEQIEYPRQLLLKSEMRLPGQGWLEFQSVPEAPDRTLLRMTVWYWPQGFLGRAYWLITYPLHVLVFDGLQREIARRAAFLQSIASRGDTTTSS